MSGGQAAVAAVPPPPITLKTPYATILTSQTKNKETTKYETFKVGVKQPKNINGRYLISWNQKEIQQSILQTNLQFTIIGKFKIANPDIHELRKVIPLQCGIKGEVIIGVLETKLILIRCMLQEDYINLLSTNGFWLTLKNQSMLMKTLKWDAWYDPRKETSIAMAWISFPNHHPNLFAEDFFYSIAMAVGKPMYVDVATRSNTRPSCARVKVEVDLLGYLSDGIEVGEHDDKENLISSKWVKIKYDYFPKYCKTCFMQGHDEEGCYAKNPNLQLKKNVEEKYNAGTGKAEDRHTLFTSGRIVFTDQQIHEQQQDPKTNNRVSKQMVYAVKAVAKNATTNDSEKQDKEKETTNGGQQVIAAPHTLHLLSQGREQSHAPQLEEGELQFPVASVQVLNKQHGKSRAVQTTKTRNNERDVRMPVGVNTKEVESQLVEMEIINNRDQHIQGMGTTKEWVQNAFYKTCLPKESEEDNIDKNCENEDGQCQELLLTLRNRYFLLENDVDVCAMGHKLSQQSGFLSGTPSSHKRCSNELESKCNFNSITNEWDTITCLNNSKTLDSGDIIKIIEGHDVSNNSRTAAMGTTTQQLKSNNNQQLTLVPLDSYTPPKHNEHRRSNPKLEERNTCPAQHKDDIACDNHTTQNIPTVPSHPQCMTIVPLDTTVDIEDTPTIHHLLRENEDQHANQQLDDAQTFPTA